MKQIIDTISKNQLSIYLLSIGEEIIKRGIILLGLLTFALASCQKHDPNSPGKEFMPDMYRSLALESDMAYVLKNGDTIQVNRLPVAGTIPRGFMPYAYANDTAGYANAGRFLHNPLAKTLANITQGEVLYGKYCFNCHGTKGLGDGLVALKFPGAPPSFASPILMALPEGKMFHTLTYGKNLMGSHASQLNSEERWKLVMYVQKLQGK